MDKNTLDREMLFVWLIIILGITLCAIFQVGGESNTVWRLLTVFFSWMFLLNRFCAEALAVALRNYIKKHR